MMELNREEIIRALECCYMTGISCHNCPLYELDKCNDALMAGYVRDLIKELTEENERLKAENETIELNYKDFKYRLKELQGMTSDLVKESENLKAELLECVNIKADTVRKMQVRLNDTKTKICGEYYIYANNVDVIAEEILEENK